MATSPYFNTSNQFIKYDIHVDETAVDNANNTSTVRVYVLAWRSNNYTTDDAGTCYVSIDGTNYSQSWSYGQKPISYNSDTVMFDKTVTIPHDPDGKKTIYVSAYFQHNRFSSNSQGFNVTLTEIPRAATLIAAQDFQDTGNPQITYNNPAGSLVTSLQACISLDGSTASVPYRDIPVDGTTYTFNLTSTERNTLLAATPNSNTLTVYFIVKTVLAGNTYTSVVSKTMTVISATPTVGNIYYQDTNATTTAITGDNTQIVQNVSTVRFRLRDITALKSATLVSATVTINGVTVTSALSGTYINSKSVDFGTINSSMNEKATIVITDSRGNTVSAEVTITMLEWKLPTGKVSLWRKDNYYDETYIKVVSTISSLDGNNAVTIQYQYKATDEANYGPLTTINNSTTYTLSLDNTKAYDFRVIVSDLLGSTTYNLVQQQGLPILFIDRLRRSVGIGAIPTENNQLVADRRISLKNPSQEIVADLWSRTSPDEQTRSAAFFIYDQNGQVLARVGGYRDNGHEFGEFTVWNENDKKLARLGMSDGLGGHVGIYDANGDGMGYMGVSSLGGNFRLGNTAGNDIVTAGPYNTDKGRISVHDGNGNRKGILFVDTHDGGQLELIDGNGNRTIDCEAGSGTIYCKKVKASEGVEELYDGYLSSGNTTFNYGNYNLYIVVAEVRSGGSYITMTIPKLLLTGTDQSYCISDEADYVTFKLKYSGSTATLTFGSRSSSGSIVKVYGVN